MGHKYSAPARWERRHQVGCFIEFAKTRKFKLFTLIEESTMKNLVKTTLVALATTAALSSQAMADAPVKSVRFVGDTDFAGFCKAIVKDDIRLLRSSLARNVGRIAASQREVLRLVTAEDGMTCNGTNLIEFSVERNADSVYQYLTQRS